MSADSFHAMAEKQFKKAGKILDFTDYVTCLRAVGKVLEMQPSQFRDFKSRISQSAAAAQQKPLLAEVHMVEFRRQNPANLYFKKSHDEVDFSSWTNFLVKPVRTAMNKGLFFTDTPVKNHVGLAASRKQGIIDKLCCLMPEDRRVFWENIPEYDDW